MWLMSLWSFGSFIILNVGCSNTSMDSSEPVDTSPTVIEDSLPPTRVYATIITHNEQDINPGCGPVLENEQFFDLNREATLQLAQKIVEVGGAWDLQSDYRWIQQMQEWESDEDRALTGGQNILAYLVTAFPNQIVVDAQSRILV